MLNLACRFDDTVIIQDIQSPKFIIIAVQAPSRVGGGLMNAMGVEQKKVEHAYLALLTLLNNLEGL